MVRAKLRPFARADRRLRSKNQGRALFASARSRWQTTKLTSAWEREDARNRLVLASLRHRRLSLADKMSILGGFLVGFLVAYYPAT